MKILYVSTVSNQVNGFLIPHIEMLYRKKCCVDVAFNLSRSIKDKLKEVCNKIYLIPFQRNPLSLKNIVAYNELKKIIEREKYDIIHTHSPIASAIVRMICKGKKNIRVIYTAHGFHFFKKAPLKNWLLYYPIERILSRYTDVLITINKEDYNIAKKTFKAKKTKYIPGVGFDCKKYQNALPDISRKKNELGLSSKKFVLLSVGELNRNKNHKIVIKALSELNNSKIHYLICGQGPLKDELNYMKNKFGLGDQVHLLGYRYDIADIYKISDVFVFPSKREGLGISALEAMASGLPIITSNIHGINDYSINGETGFSCSPDDVEGFKNSIIKLFENDSLRKTIGENNKKIIDRYDIKNVLKLMNNIYDEEINEIKSSELYNEKQRSVCN